jgi:Rps23 Pro-64 3,4-dihydroxylase Tpa1-like proline 4-hydroxylase
MISKKLNLEQLSTLFKAASPYPHVVIDDFLEQDYYENVFKYLHEFYTHRDKKEGVAYSSEVQKDKWGSYGMAMPEIMTQLFNDLKSEKMLAFLKSVTGFDNLKVVSDENGSLAFFHVMKPGSYLGPHLDHTVDPNISEHYHVLNIILYVSKEWNPNWGGGTTIFKSSTQLASDIEFKPNRALIFMHGPDTIHGTQRISTLAQEDRYSVYFDYYSVDKNPYAHLNIPQQKLVASNTRFFLPSKLDYLKRKNRNYLLSWLSYYKRSLFK